MRTDTGPLSGIRVLDAATLLAAPTAASLLSEYGAEVIKIEHPVGGDPMRRFPPFRGTVSLLWKVVGRNRESLTIDLHRPEGQELFKKLVAKSDVVILNFRPETVAKWGLDFDDLVKVKPDIIVLHLTAFGRSGPYSDRPGFARVAEAFAGLTHRTGFPGQPPVQSGYAMLGDGLAGLYGAFAVMLALKQRDRTGEPQLIDLGLYEPILRLLEDQIAAFDQDGTVMGRIGNSNPLISPNGLFPTKDDRWVSIPASTEPIYRRLVGVIGDPSMLEHDSNVVRIANREAVESKVENWTRAHTLIEIVELCATAGIACGPVYTAQDIVQDPHILARHSVVSVDDEETGRAIKMASPAGRFSGFEGRVRHPGPSVGEHTDHIMKDLLGISEAEIADLRESGAI